MANSWIGQFVKCIDNTCAADTLSEGLAYIVVGERPRQFEIKNDNGVHHWYNKDRFVFVNAESQEDENDFADSLENTWWF